MPITSVLERQRHQKFNVNLRFLLGYPGLYDVLSQK